MSAEPVTLGTAGGSTRAASKGVLVLAHRFPPCGGAGVQRNVQLARHLPKVGYRPLILTGPGATDYQWTPPDPGLADDRILAPVHRLPGPEPPHGAPWEARLGRWARTPARWDRWWRANALRAASQVGRDAAVIHASVAPYSTAETAIAVARRLGRPLVLDFEDPWALDEMLVYPTRWHRRLEVSRMGRALRAADAVVMNTREARRRVLSTFRDLRPERIVAIPNAFDPDDFGQPPARRPAGARFRIVHVGSLHTDLGMRQRSASPLRRALGDHVPGIDPLTRSHVFLIEALESLFEERPDLRPLVEVVLAGVFTDQDRAVAAGRPFVQLRDFVPHGEAPALLRSADLLFLPMHNLPAPGRAGLVPHKTYEYIASGRPILAAVPAGDAQDLLAESGAAALCAPDDVAGMRRLLLDDIERWRSGREPRSPHREIVERCACGRLVEELAGVYDMVAAVAPEAGSRAPRAVTTDAATERGSA